MSPSPSRQNQWRRYRGGDDDDDEDEDDEDDDKDDTIADEPCAWLLRSPVAIVRRNIKYILQLQYGII